MFPALFTVFFFLLNRAQSELMKILKNSFSSFLFLFFNVKVWVFQLLVVDCFYYYLLYKWVLWNFLRYEFLNLILVQLPIDIDWMISFKGVYNLPNFMWIIDSKTKSTSLTISHITAKTIRLTEMLKLLFIFEHFMFGGIKSPRKPWERWTHCATSFNVCKE